MRLRQHTAILAAVGMLIAACGDDSDSSASGGGGDGDFQSVLLPKCLGIATFDQANEGAMEAAEELGVPQPEYIGPSSCEDPEGQIDQMTNAATQGVDAVMVSNNAGDGLQSGVDAASAADVTVVGWDSPVESGDGEDLFVAQVDFDETGTVMADMALNILGDDGGQFAILSAGPDAANQNAWIESLETVLDEDPAYENLDLVDTVYGDDDADVSYDQALSLADQHDDLELIMAPTTVGIAAAAKAMTDEGLCDSIAVSGLGLPDEMQAYTESGCAPEFALWSFVDLGYLTFHASHAIATGETEAEAGATFEAGRLGEYTIEEDPTRDNGLRVVMGPFSVYDADNIADEAGGSDAAGESDADAADTDDVDDADDE